jgi:hypothetical protein
MKSKQLIIIQVAVFLQFILFCFNASAQAGTKAASVIEWKETTIDFGKVIKDKPVTAEFHFSNPSMMPLIIFSVKPSCGCTVADFPKEPVKPGKAGVIRVTFDAADVGYFQKSVIVSTNAQQGDETLIIKGEVVATP